MVEYVDLKRNFVPVGKDAEPDLTLGSMWGRKVGGWLEWSDLLDHSRVVLLAEASSGKSEEFKHTAAGLRAKGSLAFYSTIERLSAGRLGLGPAEQELIERWQTGAEKAWFFLDSVDEARLNQKKFNDALQNFSSLIGPALARASVLVSCRASDWKGNSDRTTILEVLPAPKAAPPAAVAEEADAALLDPIFERADRKPANGAVRQSDKTLPDILVVQLISLSHDQRRSLAQACGVTDLDAFLEAIDQRGLEVLAERPGDVIELAQYWQQKKCFGSLSEMTEHSVHSKLTELDRYRPDNSELSSVKAREGAERLAAALTFGKSFTLLAPGQEPDPSLAAGALDPSALLDGWTVSEVNALLRRGIFALSTYGRIRFHHRSTQEYLAGRWLSKLLAKGCPRSAVFSVLFSERYGVETVVPSLRPAAAWVAIDQSDIRDEIIRREPMLLLTMGDPAGLSEETKSRLLRHLAERHKAGEISDDSIDRRSMWMFSSPNLASAVRDAWKINDRPEFRADLVRLIDEGKIRGCIDLAAEIAGDDAARDYHRMVGLRALVSCDATAEIAKHSKSLLSKASQIGPRLAAGAAEILFPKFINVDQLLTIVEQSRQPRAHSVDGFAYAIDRIWDVCPPVQRANLIDGLAQLALSRPFVQDYQRVSRKHAELARHLGYIARQAVLTLGGEAPSSGLIQLLSIVERAERPPRMTEDDPPLNELVRQNSAIERGLYWHDVCEVREHSKCPVVRHWEVHFGGQPLWQLDREDLDWLQDDLKSRVNEDDRRVALSAIAHLLGDELKAWAPLLKSRIDKNKVLEQDLAEFLTPPKLHPSVVKYKGEETKRAKRRARDEEKAKKSWKDFRDELTKDPSRLSNRKFVESSKGISFLRNLSEWLHKRTGKDLREAVLNWKMLEPAFSPPVAVHYCAGMKLLWRITPPEGPVRSEGGGITTKWVSILSDAAIGIEAADAEDFASSLTDDEAERAALHAVLTEQGYPDWLDNVVARHSNVVPVVRDAFRSEWTAPENTPSYLIYRFAQRSAAIGPQLQSALFNIIVSEDAPVLNTLERGIEIVRNLKLSEEQSSNLKQLAGRKFDECSASDQARAIRWVALLFLLDVPEAARRLVRWLRAVNPAECRNRVALEALGALFGNRSPLVAVSLNEAPVEVIVQLLVLAYKEVRPEDDVVHEGVFSPGVRDNAEDARNALLKALIDIPGPEAHAAMVSLAARPEFRKRRIRFLELARRMAERDAEQSPWSTKELLAFEREYVSPIRTGHDLHRVAQQVLSEIVWDFGSGDASSRAVLETARDEDAVQEYLHEQFRLRAKDRYHVAREAEIAEGNMPDILLSAVGAPFAVAVEVKHGGKGWSTNELEASLRTQLAEDYLRPSERRHGIFVVSNHKSRDGSTRRQERNLASRK